MGNRTPVFAVRERRRGNFLDKEAIFLLYKPLKNQVTGKLRPSASTEVQGRILPKNFPKRLFA
jgi:hypothetical protein